MESRRNQLQYIAGRRNQQQSNIYSRWGTSSRVDLNIIYYENNRSAMDILKALSGCVKD